MAWSADYEVHRYDPDDDPRRDGDWTLHRIAHGARDAVAAIRELRTRGYDELSIFVERLESEPA